MHQQSASVYVHVISKDLHVWKDEWVLYNKPIWSGK